MSNRSLGLRLNWFQKVYSHLIPKDKPIKLDKFLVDRIKKFEL